ncbi:uncharacterized protein LOC119604894 [Lucilia sericata]|uniref:uncharacterized protein LOC119604894 n=1 Tax=Lucilia sericata TaxID=13632 RepID=UPI0018A7FEB7|nr:uncharacterized protein LOC119604894 [Lucilia sericata]
MLTRKKVKELKEETDRVDSDEEEFEEAETNVERKHIKMDFVKPVSSLIIEGNVAENWRKFKQNFEIFLEAADLSGEPDQRKVAVLLNAVGEDGLELFQTFNLSSENKKKYQEVLAAFENFCVPEKRIVYERFLFFSRNQKDGEPFDNFLVDIKRLSKSCDFGEQQTSLMRDRIVLGINNKRLQEKLLEKDVDFENAIEICRAAEISEGQTKAIQMKNKKNNKWLHKLKIETSFIEVKLDTGSDVNILPYNVFQTLKSDNKISPTSMVLKAYGGQQIKPKGECFLKCYYNNKMSIEKFIILNENLYSILGAEAIENLEIVRKVNTVDSDQNENFTKEQFIKNNSDVFTGIGTFPGQHKIKLMENAVPVVKPPRRVPLKILNNLENSLK